MAAGYAAAGLHFFNFLFKTSISKRSFQIMRLIILLSALALAGGADAHVRWFVETDEQLSPYTWRFQDFLLVALSIGACVVAGFLSKIRPAFLDNGFFKPWPREMQFRLLGVVLGVWLLSVFYHGEFIAPNLSPTGNVGFLVGFQAIVGILLLISHRIASYTLSIFLLTALLIISTPFVAWIDYAPELLAFGIGLACASNPARATKYLRVLLGLQLVVLAIHNKLLNPNMGLMFLEMHPWNFFPMIGLTMFDDANFIIGIGMAETALGFLLIFGLATRLIAFMVLCVFGTTGSLLGIEELIGHVPIVAAFVIVFSLGTGETKYKELAPANIMAALDGLGMKVKRLFPAS